MSSEKWVSTKLSEIAQINADSISTDYPYDQIEYIDTSSVVANIFDPPQILILSKAPSRARRIVHHGDTIISTVRPIQRHFGFICHPKPNTVVSTGFATISPGRINAKFLYYYLSQESITKYLNGIAETSTTTFPAFRPDVLSDLEIIFPADETIQRRIAEILSALDDKIELDRQMNATLEAMAQAIFKEWFVDFNFPGSTGEMVESELGKIPKGWRVGKLGEMIKISSGKWLAKEDFKKNGYPVLGANGIIGYTYKYLIEDEVILTGRVGTLGKFQLEHNKVWITDNVLILSPISKASYYYTYLCIKQINVHSLNRGSTQPLLTKTDLLNQLVLIPDSLSLVKFDMISRELFNRINCNISEADTLSAIRDILVPKLISGEIMA